MDLSIIASTKLSDILRPQSSGEPVNVHVVVPAKEPAPDFEAMKKLIENTTATDGKRRETEPD